MSAPAWWRRLGLLMRRDRMTQDLEDEMRLHRELRAEELRGQGLTPDDARAAAAVRFGNASVTSEMSRDQWGWSSLHDVWQDMRYAARRLRQRPAFTISVAGVLALGIGGTTAMFSAVDAALLRPLPFERPQELFVTEARAPFRPYRPQPENERVPDLTDLARMRETFVNIAAYASGGLNLSEPDRPTRLRVGVVTREFFATLGVMPQYGRVFDTLEVSPGGPRVAILAWTLWQRFYGGRPMIDSVIPLNGRNVKVIGIMPKGFAFPDASALWIPMGIPATSATFEAFRGFLPSTSIVRLAPGVTHEMAAAQYKARWDRFVAGFPKSNDRAYPEIERMTSAIHVNGGLSPLRGELVGDRKRALLVLFGATALLLSIACINVTSLLLAHGASRRREIAVRRVLGASRGRVVRQLFTEAILISATGMAVGIALAPFMLRLIAAMMPPTLAGLSSATIDIRVLTFSVLLALFTGIAFGLWPAFGATSESAGETIRGGGGRGASARGMRRLQQVLVGGELALTLTLLVAAGLMLRSFSALIHVDSGMNAERTGSLELSFPRAQGGSVQQTTAQKIDAMLARLQSVPGIAAAAVVNDLPLSGSGGVAISVEVPGAANDNTYARYLIASEQYFDVMGVRVLQGRNFTAQDDDKANVVIVNDVFARKYWPNDDAIGRTFTWGGDTVPVTIVGVVAHVRESGLDQDPVPQMYFPARGHLGSNVAIVARGSLDRAAMLAQLRDAVQAIDRTQAITNLRMMDEVIGKSVSARRANTMLITLFGGLAFAISLFGVYAVTAYAVAQRHREFGIRSALGASRGDLIGEATRTTGWIALTGIVVGLGLAWAASRLVSSLLYAVNVHDTKTFALAPVALLLAVAVATLVPARRALRANPVEVMREE